MAIVVVIVCLAAMVAAVGYFLLSRKHPEDAAGHSTADVSGSQAYYGDVNDRPGSPGAEADGVAERGQPAPGPSAEQIDEPDGR